MFDLANVRHGCTKGLNGNNSQKQSIVFFCFSMTALYFFFRLSRSEKVISLCITEMAVLGTFTHFFTAEFKLKLLLIIIKKIHAARVSLSLCLPPKLIKALALHYLVIYRL